MSSVRFFSLLFCFRKPEIVHLSYLNLLVKEKPVLLIVWEIKNARCIKFLPLKGRHYALKNAALLSIPEDRREISIRIVNFWRGITKDITMHAVELDANTTTQLIDGFRPLNKIRIHTPVISRISNHIGVKPVIMVQRSNSITVTNRFPINIKPFNYP